MAAASPVIDETACCDGGLLAQLSRPRIVLQLSSLAQGTHRLYCGLWGIQRPQGGVLGCHIICMAGLANLGLIYSRLAGSPGLGRCSHGGAHSCSTTVGQCQFLAIIKQSAGVRAGCAARDTRCWSLGELSSVAARRADLTGAWQAFAEWGGQHAEGKSPPQSMTAAARCQAAWNVPY